MKKKVNKELVGLVVLAVLIRLILLPWAQVVHADAVARTFIAMDWLKDPHYIYHGYWGPLHHYLNALFIWIFPGKISGIRVLHILLAAGSIVPLYYFTRNVFNKEGAFYVGLIFALCPLIVRNSFQPLAGIPYAFFVLLAMYFLSAGKKRNWELRFAIFAGLSMTLAGALRYEAWVLIALFTFLLLFFRSWKFTLFFWMFSMLFPLAWMIGNHLAFGDFLYSVNQNEVWNIELEGVNDELGVQERIQRLIFFPVSFALNASPLISFMIVGGVLYYLVRGRMKKEQIVWLIPFSGMAAIFLQKAWGGTLMLQHRFVITWLILLLPFFALLFQRPTLRYLKSLTWIGVFSLIPFSFVWGALPYKKVLGDNDVGRAIDGMAMSSFWQAEAIPMIRDPRTEELLNWFEENARPNDGLILDFFGWDNTNYIALHFKGRAYALSGAKHQEVDEKKLKNYLSEHSHGYLVLDYFGKLGEIAEKSDSLLIFREMNMALEVEESKVLKGRRVYKYRRGGKAADATLEKAPAERSNVFNKDKDIEHYELLIRKNKKWFYDVRRQAIWNMEPVDSVIHDNAVYLESMEK